MSLDAPHAVKRTVRPWRDRFWEKVGKDGPDGCWVWTAGTTPNGYGTFTIGGRQEGTRGAHRVAYELARGPIPPGLQIDHLCRNRLCVNPAHLEVVTNRENVLRGVGVTAMNARKTHCKSGHPFDEENTGFNRGGGRRCRRCHRRWRREALIRARGRASPIPCLECGVMFKPIQAAKYCSVVCSVMNARRYQRHGQ